MADSHNYDLNRTPNQKKRFPIKLNEEQRYGICLRIALGWTTRQIRIWLQELDVEISYAGLRRYWRRRRWVKHTNFLRANITSRPEAQQLIRQLIMKWLDAESDAFQKHIIEIRDDLRRMSLHNPQIAERYRTAGFFLVTEFNKVINRATNLIKALGIAKGSI